MYYRAVMCEHAHTGDPALRYTSGKNAKMPSLIRFFNLHDKLNQRSRDESSPVPSGHCTPSRLHCSTANEKLVTALRDVRFV